MLEGKKVPVYGSGKNVRDWLHVDDHCRGIHAALMNGKSGEVYNIGGGRELTNLEITHLILEAMGAEISGLLAERALAALGVDASEVTAYGKGAIVGTAGEIEHAAALIHPRFGAPVRKVVIKGDDIIPSTKKVAGPGASLTIPITNKDDIWSFNEMDSIEVCIGDAPMAHEIVVSVALAVGGRPFARTKKPS